MKQYITQSLLLKLGENGYTLNKGVELIPDPCFEIIDSYVSSGPLKRIFLFPRVLTTALHVSHSLRINMASVVICIVVASRNGMTVTDLQKIIRWPIKFVKRIIHDLTTAGYISTGAYSHDARYDLTVEGITCLLAGSPITDNERMCIFTNDIPNAYHDMVNYILSIDGKMSLESYADAHVQYPVPYSPDREKSEKKLLTTDFNERLPIAIKEYLNGSEPLSVLLDTIEYCRSVNADAAVYQGLISIGYDKFNEWQKGFFLTLCEHFQKEGLEAMTFTRKNNPLGWQAEEDFDSLQKAAKSLVALGVVVMPPASSCADDDDEKKESGDRYMLSPDAVGAIFRGRSDCLDYSAICRQADLIRHDNIPQKTLYFNEDMVKDIDTLRKLLSPEVSKVLFPKLAHQGRKSLTCLLYGDPGSGKTELVRQLAAATGRDIMIADAAKLTGGYVGSGEKNAREIFRVYRYITKISDHTPILLFNEADGIISKRLTNVTQYNEKSENTIQSIILQEMEAVEGIIIATTNLEMNMDEAMDRRFLYKIRFGKPSADVRARIIHEKMPWMNERMVEAIANEFTLTGGQIDNIACRCLIEQLTTNDELSKETVCSFCRDEIAISRQRNSSNWKKIGFDG